MEVGHSKCAVIANRPLQLKLCGVELSRAKSYKYLGFNHSRLGIDFSTHIDSMVRKASDILNTVRRNGEHWPTGVRLAIHKSFIQSRMEYGLALVPSFLKGHQTPPDLYSDMQTLLNSCVSWILPQSPSHTHAAAVCGIPPIHIRAEGLAASFCNHVAFMAQDHPARILVSKLLHRRPWRSQILLPHAQSTPLHRRLTQQSADERISFRRLLKRWTIQSVEEASTTARYISRGCRRQGTGADFSLFIEDDELRNFATRWRVGAYGIRRFCPSCNQRFNRACPIRCNLPIPRFHTQLNQHPNNPPPYYCNVDAILNTRNMEWINTVKQYLETHITK